MANTSANTVSRSDRVRATCLLLVAACLWGSSFVGSKICLNAGMYPFETIFYRMAAGSLVMGIVFWKQLRAMTRQALKAGILLGLVTFSGYCFEMYGISMTAASKSSFITATNIVMLPFLYALFFHTRISLRSVGAALVTLAGIWFLSQTGSTAGGVAVGDVLLLITAFLYAMNSITVAKLGSTESPIQVTFLQLADHHGGQRASAHCSRAAAAIIRPRLSARWSISPSAPPSSVSLSKTTPFSASPPSGAP